MLELHKTTVALGQIYCPASLQYLIYIVQRTPIASFTIHMHKPLLFSLSLSPPITEAGALFATSAIACMVADRQPEL